MMNILIFHPALAPYRVDFFNELGKRVNLKVIFMTRNNENQPFNQTELLKDATYTYGYLDKHYKFMKRNINLGYWKEIDSFKPDIVVCNEFGVSTWSCYAHKNIKQQCYKIFTLCDDSEDVLNNRVGLRKSLSHFFAKNLDGMICINPKVATRYKELGVRKVSLFPIIYKDSLYSDKLQMAISVTNRYVDDFKLKGCKCFLFVGRFTYVKNLKRLIESFARLQKKSQDKLRLIMVGDGDLKDELMEECKNRGMSNSVIFPGRFEGMNLLAWYNLKGSCVLFSTHEPFGAVVAEALMAGMPSIVSDKVGAKCLITERNGLICSSENISDMEEKMALMLNRIPPVEEVSRVKESILSHTFDSLMDNLISDFKEC